MAEKECDGCRKLRRQVADWKRRAKENEAIIRKHVAELTDCCKARDTARADAAKLERHCDAHDKRLQAIQGVVVGSDRPSDKLHWIYRETLATNVVEDTE